MKTAHKEVNILTDLRKFLSVDPYETPINTLIEITGDFAPTDRLHLLGLIERALSRIDYRRREEIRVSLVKALVALFPDSWEVIQKWLSNTSDPHSYEVHFSLFCFLDSIQEVAEELEFRAQIPELIGRYLSNASRNTAMATWMAGDLLGDHWLIEEALPILIRVATRGKFVAGRKSALHGLAQTRSKLAKRMLENVNKVLRDISEDDRSNRIRRYAKLILTNDGKGEMDRIIGK